MATEGPFAACVLAGSSNSDSNTTTYNNHPSYIFGWLKNGIAYSGNGITHSCYFSILFMLAGEGRELLALLYNDLYLAFSRAIFKRTSMLHGGKLTSTSHVLVLIIVGMVLCLGVELWRYFSSPECLRGIWMFTDVGTGSISEGEGALADCDISYLYFGLLPLLIFKPSFDIDYNFILRNIDTIIILGAATLLSLIVSLQISFKCILSFDIYCSAGCYFCRNNAD